MNPNTFVGITIAVLLVAATLVSGQSSPSSVLGSLCVTTPNNVLTLRWDFQNANSTTFTLTNFGVAFPACIGEPYSVQATGTPGAIQINFPAFGTVAHDCMFSTVANFGVTGFSMLGNVGSVSPGGAAKLTKADFTVGAFNFVAYPC